MSYTVNFCLLELPKAGDGAIGFLCKCHASQHFASSAKRANRIYNFVAFIGMVLTYFPEKQIVLKKEDKMQTLKKIDWLGAVLSITGITLL